MSRYASYLDEQYNGYMSIAILIATCSKFKNGNLVRESRRIRGGTESRPESPLISTLNMRGKYEEKNNKL